MEFGFPGSFLRERAVKNLSFLRFLRDGRFDVDAFAEAGGR